LTRWSRRFESDPLPDGGELTTLRDAGHYITALPKAKHNRPELRLATRILMQAGEDGMPIMLAEIAVRRALNAGKPGPRRKAAKKSRLSDKSPVVIDSTVAREVRWVWRRRRNTIDLSGWFASVYGAS
jgi:hypothetical protein